VRLGWRSHPMKLPKASDVADLVRLPSVLSVPGDVLLGVATSGRRERPAKVAGLAAASSCLYLAGMALNDYADRKTDAEERPARPIPSGRVSPKFALGLSAGLTTAGLGLAYAAGRWRSLGVAVPLAATVWAYDLAAKKTSWGPVAMAGCRSLDVLMGVTNIRRAWPAVGIIGGHTFLITTVSRKETEGATKGLALGALAGTAAVTAAAARFSLARSRDTRYATLEMVRRDAALVLLGAHALNMGKAEIGAIKTPSASNLQKIVSSGVLGLMPLEAGMLAGTGALGKAAVLAAGWRLARKLARKRSVT
jgi:UbiA prenyltransferase family